MTTKTKTPAQALEVLRNTRSAVSQLPGMSYSQGRVSGTHWATLVLQGLTNDDEITEVLRTVDTSRDYGRGFVHAFTAVADIMLAAHQAVTA